MSGTPIRLSAFWPRFLQRHVPYGRAFSAANQMEHQKELPSVPNKNALPVSEGHLRVDSFSMNFRLRCTWLQIHEESWRYHLLLVNGMLSAKSPVFVFMDSSLQVSILFQQRVTMVKEPSPPVTNVAQLSSCDHHILMDLDDFLDRDTWLETTGNRRIEACWNFHEHHKLKVTCKTFSLGWTTQNQRSLELLEPLEPLRTPWNPLEPLGTQWWMLQVVTNLLRVGFEDPCWSLQTSTGKSRTNFHNSWPKLSQQHLQVKHFTPNSPVWITYSICCSWRS